MMSRMSTIFIIFICILQTLAGCISYPDTGNEVRMELPSHSDTDCIIEYNGYTVSYDEAALIPAWVAYELTAEEANGTIGRSGKNFRPDDKVKVIQADNYDYRGSGWSRGHMAPAGDFKWNDDAMWDTFFYTNCCPQDEKLNKGSWNVLEIKSGHGHSSLEAFLSLPVLLWVKTKAVRLVLIRLPFRMPSSKRSWFTKIRHITVSHF